MVHSHQLPSPPALNDGNVAIACLSLGIDGSLLLHKVMRYLPFIESHLALYDTCSTFRRLLATETFPITASNLFDLPVGLMISHAKRKRGTRDERERNRQKRIRFRTLLRVMAINTPIAAAVLATSIWVYRDLLEALCGVWKDGPTEGSVGKVPRLKAWWECCNDEVMAALLTRKRKRDLGAAQSVTDSSSPDHGVMSNQVCATEKRMLCIRHRRLLQSVVSLMLTRECYNFGGIDALEPVVHIIIQCRNPRFIATTVLPKLETMGVLTPDPSPVHPAFSFFPAPPRALPNGSSRPLSPGHNAHDHIACHRGQQCLHWLYKAAFTQKWDPLIDHLLLRYPFLLPFTMFEEACKEGCTALAMRILELRGKTGYHPSGPPPTNSGCLSRKNLQAGLTEAIIGHHEDTVRFLLWIGRHGMDDMPGPDVKAADPQPWLKDIRKRFEILARHPVTDPNALRITLPGLRAVATDIPAVEVVDPQRIFFRLAATNGTLPILALLVSAAGGWRAIAEHTNPNGTTTPIVHHFFRINDCPITLIGLEDLLILACQKGTPATARFLIAKYRRDNTGVTGDAWTRAVDILSECLGLASYRKGSDTDALEICKALLFDTAEEEAIFDGRASAAALIATPARNNGVALKAAAYRGHERVMALLLADPRLPTAALQVALVGACFEGRDAIVSQLLAQPGLDVNAGPRQFNFKSVSGSRRMMHVVMEMSKEGGKALKLGHALVVAAIVDGHVGLLRVLLADPRIDAGGGVAAVRLACASRSSEMVLEVLAQPAYTKELWKRDEEEACIPRPDVVKELTYFVVSKVKFMSEFQGPSMSVIVQMAPAPSSPSPVLPSLSELRSPPPSKPPFLLLDALPSSSSEQTPTSPLLTSPTAAAYSSSTALINGLPASAWIRILGHTGSLTSLVALSSASRTLRAALWPPPPSLTAALLVNDVYNGSPDLALLGVVKSPFASNVTASGGQKGSSSTAEPTANVNGIKDAASPPAIQSPAAKKANRSARPMSFHPSWILESPLAAALSSLASPTSPPASPLHPSPAALTPRNAAQPPPTSTLPLRFPSTPALITTLLRPPHNADIHFYGDACLRHAVRRLPSPSVRALLAGNADAAIDASEPLFEAIARGRWNLVPSLFADTAAPARCWDRGWGLLAVAVFGPYDDSATTAADAVVAAAAASAGPDASITTAASAAAASAFAAIASDPVTAPAASRFYIPAAPATLDPWPAPSTHHVHVPTDPAERLLLWLMSAIPSFDSLVSFAGHEGAHLAPFVTSPAALPIVQAMAERGWLAALERLLCAIAGAFQPTPPAAVADPVLREAATGLVTAVWRMACDAAVATANLEDDDDDEDDEDEDAEPRETVVEDEDDPPLPDPPTHLPSDLAALLPPTFLPLSAATVEAFHNVQATPSRRGKVRTSPAPPPIPAAALASLLRFLTATFTDLPVPSHWSALPPAAAVTTTTPRRSLLRVAPPAFAVPAAAALGDLPLLQLLAPTTAPLNPTFATLATQLWADPSTVTIGIDPADPVDAASAFVVATPPGAPHRARRDLALRAAAAAGRAAAVAWLLGLGADAGARDGEPLATAVAHETPHAAHLLLATRCVEGEGGVWRPGTGMGEFVGAQEHAAVRFAATAGVVGLVVELGGDVRAVEDEALVRACAAGRAEVVGVLLARGADGEARGRRGWRDARRLGHGEVVRVLEEWAGKRKRRTVVFGPAGWEVGGGGGVVGLAERTGRRRREGARLSGVWGAARVVSVAGVEVKEGDRK
ncbi:hypothetical protein HDU96_006154 [Phlyctochytrium bullatum]|nr:hypothetical protein HDU96_006154 [Phlyctochytrium bullatum]